MENKRSVNFSVKVEMLYLIALVSQLYSYNYGQNWITSIVFWATILFMVWSIGLMALTNLFELKLTGEVKQLPKWKWHMSILYIVIEGFIAYMFFLLGREIFGLIVVTYSLSAKYQVYLIRQKIKVAIENCEVVEE